MHYNKFKNLTIIFLVVLTIYQTCSLWIENISETSFFYSMNISKENSKTKTHNPFIEPYRIITKLDNGKFGILYDNLDKIKLKRNMDKFFEKFLKKAVPLKSEKLNMNNVMKNSFCIFEYKVLISASTFTKCFYEKSTLINQFNFNKIIFQIDELNKGSINVIFYDGQNCNAYTLSDNSLIDLVEENNYQDYQINYRLENQNFIPDFETIELNKLTLSNPYMEGDDLLLGTIEKNINQFFENPTNKQVNINDNIFTFSNETIVVKYYPNNILEYVSYKNTNNVNNLSIEENYLQALNFLKNDSTIKNNLLLSDYSISKDNEVTFYFDYTLNNIPIHFSENCSKELGIQHFITLKIISGNVTEYKKLVYNINDDSENKFTIKNYDQFILQGQSNANCMELIFKFENNFLEPYWQSTNYKNNFSRIAYY